MFKKGIQRGGVQDLINVLEENQAMTNPFESNLVRKEIKFKTTEHLTHILREIKVIHYFFCICFILISFHFQELAVVSTYLENIGDSLANYVWNSI